MGITHGDHGRVTFSGGVIALLGLVLLGCGPTVDPADRDAARSPRPSNTAPEIRSPPAMLYPAILVQTSSPTATASEPSGTPAVIRLVTPAPDRVFVFACDGVDLHPIVLTQSLEFIDPSTSELTTPVTLTLTGPKDLREAFRAATGWASARSLRTYFGIGEWTSGDKATFVLTIVTAGTVDDLRNDLAALIEPNGWTASVCGSE